ncbi:MAG: hypothetical protein M0Q87_11870 [Ottowia sp.]|nr:hypothetical protein [Ottowia sp.]
MKVERPANRSSSVQRTSRPAFAAPRSTLNAQRSTLNAQRSTLNAQRSTLNAQRSTQYAPPLHQSVSEVIGHAPDLAGHRF